MHAKTAIQALAALLICTLPARAQSEPERSVYTDSLENLSLPGAVVTARLSKDEINTTRTIGRLAMDHMQLGGLSNVGALMPGGKTVNPDLTQQQELSVRSGGIGAGNAAFGTAVELNGVRLGSNASFGALAGVDTRSLGVDNIESVEVISGVPSAEYGDVGSGIVKVHTKKGLAPWQINFSVNPRTRDVSFSKGLELGGGTLNLSGQWTRAYKKLTSPYTAYTRRGFSLEYNRVFASLLRLEAGISGNIGGMNSKDDPDSFSEQYSQGRDNLLVPRLKLVLLAKRQGITNLTAEASVYYHDQRLHEHLYNSYASAQPAVHATEQGYWLATSLPTLFYADRITDSRELDYAASLKYTWLEHRGPVKNVLKAGLQWKADGNVGEGEYYEDPSLAAAGYRPRPYSAYPYMHSLGFFAEDKLELSIGDNKLGISAGIRGEKVFVKGSGYDGLGGISPRLNLRWSFPWGLSLRGGWGISRKLPSFWVLYPRQEYLDILSSGFNWSGGSAYIYYTRPYTLEHNPSLRLQSSWNSELGADWERGGWTASLVAFHQLTKDPYEYATIYEPFTYNTYKLPDGLDPAGVGDFRIDSQTGAVYLRGGEGEYYMPMELSVQDRSFIARRLPRGGDPVQRLGLEFTLDTPEIAVLHTKARLDASYTHTFYNNTLEQAYYKDGWSHPSLANRSYPYVGIYAGGNTPVQGRRTDYLDANLTLITHIPEIRLVVSCRIEATLLRSSQNTSERAYSVSEGSLEPTGEDIYGGNTYTAVAPVAYLDLDGVRHAWDADAARDPDLQRLIQRSGNRYLFAADGYDPYLSANLSVTKEIGKHLSLSFFANNFTQSRPYRSSWATGVAAIFTPSFYYGLSCRIKL